VQDFKKISLLQDIYIKYAIISFTMFENIKLVYSMLLYNISRRIEYPLVKPINITLITTNRCYSRCKTCNIWKIAHDKPESFKEEFSLEEWKKTLKSLGRSPIWFTLTGGETMLMKDLVGVVGLIARYNKPKFINIATSGIYPKKTIDNIEKILETLSPKNILLTVNLSVDEIGERYDFVRGVPGGFNKVIETLKGFKRLKKKYPKFIIGTNVVLSKYNNKRFKDICNHIIEDLKPDSLVSEVGAKRKTLHLKKDISIPLDEYIENLDFLIENETQIGEARITSFFRKRYYCLVKEHLIKNKEIVKCYSLYASCDISCTGEVSNCPVLSEEIGNLRTVGYDFYKLWFSKRAKDVRRQIKKDRCFCNTANPNYTNLLSEFKIR